MEAKLVDHMGNDMRVCDAARVSFNKLAENYTEEQNDKLLGYLAKHNHWTPFSHPQITIHEKVPIFVARQRFKHMVGFTYNEVSRRYVSDEPEFFTPKEWRGKPVNAKQGSSDEVISSRRLYVRTDGHEGNFGDWEVDYLEYKDLINLCKKWYQSAIAIGVAPEQARMVLPQSLMTEYYCTGSLSAWARAYRLRIDGHSQKEIQELAAQWGEILEPLFPKSWKALTQ